MLELLQNLFGMTCSVLGFKKYFSSFQQLTRLIFRWLAVESRHFQQLTGHKISLCTGESPDYAKNEFSLQNFDSIKTQCVSDFSPCILTATWASTFRSGWDFCLCFCFNLLIFLLRRLASHHRLLLSLVSFLFLFFSLTLCLANLSNAALVFLKFSDNFLYLSLITLSKTSCWAITSFRCLIFWDFFDLNLFDVSPT